MAIHDPRIEVTCDGDGCRESVEIVPDYKYRNMSGSSGFYDTSDSAIEDKLANEDWTVIDGKHFCESCGKSAGDPAGGE